MFTTLIDVPGLAKHLNNPNWAIFDCRFSLGDAGRGRQDYMSAHIPGAVYAHLDEDMSARVIPGVTGRHPLPTVEQAVNRFSEWGINENVQVVVYDDAGGALAAVRLWCLLRWLGHDAVAVLDGGWQAWVAQGLDTKSEVDSRPPRQFKPQIRPDIFVDAAQVELMRTSADYLVIDVRAAERYRGEVEPIDPVAGHIPGAISAPYEMNLTAQGAFRPVDELKRDYLKLLGEIPTERVVFYCGSGVTSIHSLLALKHAGLGEAKLYPGSWSEWITDSSRPVATGA